MFYMQDPWGRTGNFIREVETELSKGLDVMRHWPLNTAQSPYKFSSYTTANSLIVEGVVPGLSKKDIQVEVVDSVLHISSEKESEAGNTAFNRKFTVPENSDADKITANCKDGLLTITIPKITPEVIARKITVK